MAEGLPRVRRSGGPEYVLHTAQVCGRRSGHMWEGWIEFVSADGNDVLRSSRETTQPDREALDYWAGGLSTTYLEGALVRALEPARAPAVPTPSHPYFDAPLPPLSDAPTVDRAILDPFSVGAKGETLLRSELGALQPWHLRNIVRAYRPR